MKRVIELVSGFGKLPGKLEISDRTVTATGNPEESDRIERKRRKSLKVLERVRRFELPTNGLGSRCATTALHPLLEWKCLFVHRKLHTCRG